jgi:hypothetical protein
MMSGSRFHAAGRYSSCRHLPNSPWPRPTRIELSGTQVTFTYKPRKVGPPKIPSEWITNLFYEG